MIKYALKCAHGHAFEGWFSSSSDYDRQQSDALLECPVCGSNEVSKALMAPAVVTGRSASVKHDAMRALAHEWNDVAKKAKAYVERNFENVGKRFPEEARKQHYGEAEAKPIYGEATPHEVKARKDEGVAVAPVPEPKPEPSAIKKKLN